MVSFVVPSFSAFFWHFTVKEGGQTDDEQSGKSAIIILLKLCRMCVPMLTKYASCFGERNQSSVNFHIQREVTCDLDLLNEVHTLSLLQVETVKLHTAVVLSVVIHRFNSCF